MEINNFVKEYLETTFKFLQINPSFDVGTEDDAMLVKIQGDDLSFLIGRRGDTLEGLQFLLGLSVFQHFGDWTEIRLDVNDYRDKKRDKIEEIAKNFIDRVRFFSKEVSLPPMSASERKFVHEFVGEYEDVESFSVGEGLSRRVILKLRD